MRRRLFTVASIVSLLLCVATVALWGRSERRHDWLFYYKEGHKYEIHSELGRITYAQWDTSFLRFVNDASWHTATAETLSPGSVWFGFDTYHGKFAPPLATGTYTGYGFFFPMWCPVLLFSFLPILRLFIYTRKRIRAHLRRGCCMQCGYNLTGNTSGFCPECGTAIRQPVRAE